MNYDILEADGTYKRVYGIRKQVLITKELNKVASVSLILGVHEVIQYGGYIATGKKNERIMIPCKQVELKINTETGTLSVDSLIETSERVSAPIDLWILYTKI